MGDSPIIGISHGIIWVRDLETAAAAYRRLGFSLSQLYVHPKTVGTANYNMMFENDYLELLVSVEKNERNAARDARLDAEGDGFKDVSLETKDADAAFKTVEAAGLSPLPVFDHHRPEGDKTARFRLIYLPPDRLLPGLGFHVIQYMTPELMWAGHTLVHANGARGIAGLVVAAADPEAIAQPYARILGVEMERLDNGIVGVKVGKARLRVVPLAGIDRLFPGMRFSPVAPYVAATELFVDDPARTRAYFESAGIAHRTAADAAVEVAPDIACGVALRFVSEI